MANKKWKNLKKKPTQPKQTEPTVDKDKQYWDLCESITQPGSIFLVRLKNGLVFQIHDYNLIPQVIKELGAKAIDTPWGYSPPVYAPPPAKPPTVATSPPVYSSAISYPSSTIDKLESMLGKIASHSVACPSLTCDYSCTLWSMVQHLNDSHQWTRERIADWLETLDVDLTIAHVVECEWCEKKYHDVDPFGQHLCSAECGAKLAEFDKDNKEVTDPEKRKALISAYRELDSLTTIEDITNG